MSLDRVKGSLVAIIESVIGPRLDYRAAHPAKVVTQHLDGTLDVVPDNADIAPMTKVPIRYGVPGVTAKIAVGARVLVEFAGGNPERPIATVWESASVTELTVKADVVRLADGDMPLARQGDIVAVQLPVGANSGGPVVWTPAPDPSPTARAYGTIISGSSFSKTK